MEDVLLVTDFTNKYHGGGVLIVIEWRYLMRDDLFTNCGLLDKYTT